MLSQQIIIGSEALATSPMCLKNLLNQTPSCTTTEQATKSTSIVDKTTHDFFTTLRYSSYIKDESISRCRFVLIYITIPISINIANNVQINLNFDKKACY